MSDKTDAKIDKGRGARAGSRAEQAASLLAGAAAEAAAAATPLAGALPTLAEAVAPPPAEVRPPASPSPRARRGGRTERVSGAAHPEAIAALLGARHGDPFGLLG
ncbi:MAG TPA: hypothetical protein VEA41_03770, partial [Salinarimonas sp.]|nr:hypothetical protein [Salinarimonas sp.]